MSESKEFLGKTLDAAIAEACAYYDVPREKLEIDIIEDAKTGIFGIVGARKAKIMARLATLPDFVTMSMPRPEREGRGRGKRRRDKAEIEAPAALESDTKEKKEAKAAPAVEAPALEEKAEAPSETPVREEERRIEEPVAAPADSVQEEAVRPDADAEPADEADVQAESAEDDKADDEAPRGRRSRRERQPRQNRREAAPSAERADKQEKADKAADDADLESALPRIPLAELDQEKLIESTRDVISRLVAPVLDVEPEEVALSVEVGEDRMQVSVKSEDTGLLIGRDGQNLAAVQYLATRMITRTIGSQVRVQVDAGDYHVRQDTRLQELALSLAEKVKATGKVQTTRPLSAYQRRVIHLALQDDPDVQTRSSGEGALKHVVILKRKD